MSREFACFHQGVPSPVSHMDFHKCFSTGLRTFIAPPQRNGITRHPLIQDTSHPCSGLGTMRVRAALLGALPIAAAGLPVSGVAAQAIPAGLQQRSGSRPGPPSSGSAEHRVVKSFMTKFSRNMRLAVLEDSKGDVPEAERLAMIAKLKREAAEEELAEAEAGGGAVPPQPVPVPEEQAVQAEEPEMMAPPPVAPPSQMPARRRGRQRRRAPMPMPAARPALQGQPPPPPPPRRVIKMSAEQHANYKKRCVNLGHTSGREAANTCLRRLEALAAEAKAQETAQAEAGAERMRRRFGHDLGAFLGFFARRVWGLLV